ncbi:hypothetical protein GGD56_006154 [Rhizobium mongolense]|uniref:Uncharacterized protein n=1 Tax=Rhizobium mongolense TaxID=57676 RepID=A0ABR6IWG4_9HYPH|nr:hypothetical protein [Rhizobium mongolense]
MNYFCILGKLLAVCYYESCRLLAERNDHIWTTISVFGGKISSHTINMGVFRKSRKVEKFGEKIDLSLGGIQQPLSHGLSGGGGRCYSFIVWVEN